MANARTLEQLRRNSMASPRLTTTLLTLFAALALVITATGLAGVIAFSVTQRTHEIGIRMALGAERGEVLQMVMRQGLAMVVVGLAIERPGSIVGYVGVPHGVEFPVGQMFIRNKGVLGGPAPARAYIPELMPDVLEGRINPGRVFDFDTGLDGVADAYAAMDERRSIKVLLQP